MSTTYFATALDSWMDTMKVTADMIAKSGHIDSAHTHRIHTGENLPSIAAFARIYGALSYGAALRNPKFLEEHPGALERCFNDLFTAWSLDWGARGQKRRARRS